MQAAACSCSAIRPCDCPFLWQGINCGFEDCTILLELLDRHGADWEKVFSEFEESRRANTDAIADLAVENFVEMRDRVADPHFLFRKKVELALEAKYPQHFVPKYSMVTFHRIPYSTALKRGRIQDAMLAELCQGIDRVEEPGLGKSRSVRSKPTYSAGSCSEYNCLPTRRGIREGMDARDPLAHFRDRFCLPKTTAAKNVYTSADIRSDFSRKARARTSSRNCAIGPISAWKAIFTGKIPGCPTIAC